MHIFKYSPRRGTKAAEMDRQVERKVKEERSQQLMMLSDKNQKEYNDTYIGQEVEILCEEEKNGYYQGHTSNYILGWIKSKENLENKNIKARCIYGDIDHIVLEKQKNVTKM